MIDLQDVTKIYTGRQKETEVLHGISLKIGKGEFVAVMGASGSGKTTFLNLLGGLDRIDKGSYFYNDIPVHKLGLLKLNQFRKEHIGFVFQNYNLLDDCTIFENTELPLLLRNVKKQERKQRVMELLRLLSIEQYAKKLPVQLSGGEQQRCAIARAVIAGNELLLADEPTGALDSQTGIEVMELLVKLNKEKGITIVMATHDQKVADYADKIICIKDGNLIS